MKGKGRLWIRGALALMLCALLAGQALLPGAAAEGEPASDPPVADTGTATTDTPPVDTETPPADTETPPADTETPPVDTETPPADTETPPVDDTPPVCDIPGCTHIGLDADGNEIALCPLGEWMLLHGEHLLPEAMDAAPMMALFAAPAPGAVSLIDGTTTLYRSGTYTLSGGSAASTVIVSDSLAVAIILKDATVGTLSLGSNVSLQLGFYGYSTIGAMHAGSGDTTFDGTGSLTVGSVDDLGAARFTMLGGSLCLPDGATSDNGRQRFDFAATGASSATVDGASFPFTMPDGSGTAHLWLPAPAGGGGYRSAVAGGVLEVRSNAADPSASDTFDMDGTAEYAAVANQSVSVLSSGGAPLSHTLTVDQTGVTLILNNVLLSAQADVAAADPVRLHIGGTCAVQSISGAGAASLTGSGILSVGNLTVGTLYCESGVRLRFGSASGGISAWQALTSPVDLDTVTELSYNGKSYAIAYALGEHTAFYAPLPAPAASMRYDLQYCGGVLTAAQVPAGTTTLTLTDAGLTITADGSYVIVTDGASAGTLTVLGGVNATLVLRSARTGGGLAVGAGAGVTLSLEGASRFGGVTLGDGATFAVGGTGALLADSVSASGAADISVGQYTNLTLATGMALGGSALRPTVINVVDSAASPVTNTAITLKIGKKTPFRTTTAGNGRVTLWGSNTVSNASVVVLSQANTYADILSGTLANPDALPEITDVVSHTTGYVTFTAAGAQTMGIQAYVNRAGAAMPDTYDATALQVPKVGGECNIPGLKPGDTVAYRAYAARLAGQALSADTADAFQFSDVYTFTVTDPRKKFALADQSKEYDRSAFSFRSGLIPRGATVTYYRGGTELSSAPVDAGQYSAAVAIPAGNAEYLPGVTMVGVTIRRKVVLIYPDEAYKIKGQPDPEFTYTWGDMYGSDEVTGTLRRVAGERYGNYPYVTDWLVAPDCYELVIDPESPMFFIDWGPGHYIPLDPLSVIDPVHQVIEFSDGTRLDLLLATVERLTITHTGYGQLVSDPTDRRVRPFTPELRLRRGYDEALLILTGEPEINDDGGYATDADGNVIQGPRTLTLMGSQLSHFRRQHITALAFRLGDALVMFTLSDLESDAVREGVEAAGMSRMGLKYQVTLTPVNSVADLAQYPDGARTDRALGASMAGVRIEAVNGGQTLDIAPLMPSATLAFDASALLAEAAQTTPEIGEAIGGRPAGQTEDDGAVTTDVMELMQRLTLERLQTLGTRLNYYTLTDIQTLDSALVVPYTASEAEATPYTAVLHVSPYLRARLAHSGLYGLALSIAP